MNLKQILFVIALFAVNQVFPQGFTSEETRQDLESLKSAMETYQPGLLKYNSNFNSNAEQLMQMIPDDSLSFPEYYKWVSRFCVLGGEGHYLIGNWEDTVKKGILNGTYRYLPIDVVILGGKVYVEKDLSNEQSVPLGTELISINNQHIGEVLQQLYYSIPADGHILTQVKNTLNRSFARDYFFFIEQPETFVIRTRDSIGNVHQRFVKALTLKEQRSNLREHKKALSPYPSTANAVYTLDRKDNCVILKLKTFNNEKLTDQKIKARKFYKSIFDSLRTENVQNLIVDLRGNLGGRFEMATEMVPFIMKEQSDDDYIRKSTSWTGKEKNYKLKKPSKLLFSGKIYVLVDGNTFSSASALARYLKEYGNAIVIGEETGTRYEGFAAGSREFITLPNSGIQIGIPRYHIEFPKSKKQTTQNRGLIPDHQIEYDIHDREHLRDLHLEKALELIQK